MFRFIKSSNKIDNWYKHNNNEIAFWGRSNVGKSSLINSIVDNKKLARVSKTPGRTQMLNFFENEFGAVFVDLPGYGYAKLSKEKIDQMMKMIEEFLIKRENLVKLYLLIDSRHSITKNDENVIEFLNKINLEYTLVFTKADKLRQKDKNTLIKSIKTNRDKFKFNKYFIVSSETKAGINELVLDINQAFEEGNNEE
ncbi:YihA family ribosome biogenesis GTP-binding protein [Mycoplasma sp. CSL10137]|uniref:ribosome biogenesis GTP-binding protein YihA/YsxC n=1 Tax=unclassified Mycoplasma TaxID=2683645 RepID=UPI00197B3857|nr:MULTISPECIES: ribosome biogenesis GTP-binding protein YihA/YsxC [unclassified Mycoplasma]MBN4083491.1 YihA family ribosome biogenesis GTP-binding protein [Mycoplasma sp. CSL10137]MBN4084578.1 YihA family ribosome biogenesis GTP-binding protein [Mycoplasma sp. CSL10166]MBU4693056.1 ribosome biogenesis GTP-binding protein YihA/YsxC [Mycoplasma sp. CSL7491-lung]MCU4706898.1 ribosome biogenesis GTP-binding protein YihA/YsxC [Mycoplasma sp. CSL7503-lung]